MSGAGIMKLSRQCLELAALFDCVDDILAWIKDCDNRYQWVNRPFLINYALERGGGGSEISSLEVLGKTDHDLSPAFLADTFRLDDEYVLSGKRIVNRIEMVRQPDGLTVWNVTNKIPLFDDDGRVVGTAGMTRRLDGPLPDAKSGGEFGVVLRYIRDHFHTQLSNRCLAGVAHMSVRAFERKFLRAFHLTPQAYLRRLRLQTASRSLAHGAQTLAEVAMACGFSDQSHFTRAFRDQFGVSPRRYRARYMGTHTVDVSVQKPAADIPDSD